MQYLRRMAIMLRGSSQRLAQADQAPQRARFIASGAQRSAACVLPALPRSAALPSLQLPQQAKYAVPLYDRLRGGDARRRSMATAATASAEPQTFQYQAEVDRLMDMIVNSLYSNRDVFLRELISNASDALDKARFLSLTNPDMLKGKEELEIRVSFDKGAKTVTIEDSGIGMTRAQLQENLGTIARSGTKKFLENMKANQQAGPDNLIGQFGVGFYSAFLVADRVVVQTKSPEEGQQWAWESTSGSHSYSIAEDSKGEQLVRGTRVTLHLKEDAMEMADHVKLTQLIKQYSQFISFPILVYAPDKKQKKIVDEAATARKQEAADAKAKEKGEEKAEKVEPVMKAEFEDVWEWKKQNENKPLWMQAPKDVAEKDYDEFFKMTFSEFLEPLAHVHFNVEGTIEFASILYIPGMAPFEQNNFLQRQKNIKLYVKRVFISDEFDEDLIPRYLSFIKGVVDSSDLPLNVSREILQESRVVRVIRKQLIKRSLDMMDDLAKSDNPEDYKQFWEAFGRNIKVGVIEDTENRQRLAKLLRFFSSSHTEEPISLDAYVSRMKEGQKQIYWMAADSVAAASSAPFVEKLVDKGYEVLYLTEPVDEATISNLAKFGEHELVDVSKEGLDLGEDEGEKKAVEEAGKRLEGTLKFLKEALGEKVEKVVVSSRLTGSPCALATSKFGWSANMERLMRSQSSGDMRSMEYMKGRKILEVNPQHEIIGGIEALLAAGDQAKAKDAAVLLFETALLTSGFSLEAPKDYAGRVFGMMKSMLGGSAGAGASSSAGSSSSEPVEATVLPGDGKN